MMPWHYWVQTIVGITWTAINLAAVMVIAFGLWTWVSR